MAPGEEGLLLHDGGPGLPNHQAKHSSAGDDAHSAAHSLPNSSAHTASHDASYVASDTSSHDASYLASDSASHDAATGTSRPPRPLQLRSGHVDELGSRQEGMVLHQSHDLRRQSDPGAASS